MPDEGDICECPGSPRQHRFNCMYYMQNYIDGKIRFVESEMSRGFGDLTYGVKLQMNLRPEQTVGREIFKMFDDASSRLMLKEGDVRISIDAMTGELLLRVKFNGS